MQWYYSKDSAQHGPVTLPELQQKIHNGELPADTLVWRDGMVDWATASGISEIATAGAPTVPPPTSAASVYAPPANADPIGYPPIPNARPTSGLAIASLILGILALTTCTFAPGIPAVICGHLAMKHTHPETGNRGGRGMAIAGLIMGYLASAFVLIFILYFFIAIGAAASAASF